MLHRKKSVLHIWREGSQPPLITTWIKVCIMGKNILLPISQLYELQKKLLSFLSRSTARWNVSSLSNKETGTKTNGVMYPSVHYLIMNKKHSKCREKIRLIYHIMVRRQHIKFACFLVDF